MCFTPPKDDITEACNHLNNFDSAIVHHLYKLRSTQKY